MRQTTFLALVVWEVNVTSVVIGTTWICLNCHQDKAGLNCQNKINTFVKYMGAGEVVSLWMEKVRHAGMVTKVAAMGQGVVEMGS